MKQLIGRSTATTTARLSTASSEFGTQPHQLQALLLERTGGGEAREEVLQRIWKRVDADGGELDPMEVKR